MLLTLIKISKNFVRSGYICHYQYIEIASGNGVIFYRRDKYTSTKKISEQLDENGFHERAMFRKTSRSFAMHINAKPWNEKKTAFFKKHKINDRVD